LNIPKKRASLCENEQNLKIENSCVFIFSSKCANKKIINTIISADYYL
jgi:hypothetical protein